MIYTSARWADEAHTTVTGTDADGNTETRSIDTPHEFRREGEFLTGFLAAGGVIEPYVAPEQPVSWPQISDGGLARFSGISPVVVLESVRTVGVTRVAKGRYRVTHQEAMPSDQYSISTSLFDALPRVCRVTARTASFVEVRVTDLDSIAQDASEITVKTERVMAQ